MPNPTDPEHELDKRNQLVATEHGARLFRNNVGQGWVGKSERTPVPMAMMIYPGDVVIRHARPLHAGLCVGSSDLIGWTRDGRFLAVEDKSASGRPTPEQRAFFNAVSRAGGVAVLAYSTDDLIRAIK